MTANLKRVLLWSVIGALLLLALVWAFAPKPITVDLVRIEPAPMIVTLDEEAQTRVHDTFTLSAPVAGKLLRIEAHVGDPVIANETILARIQPVDPTFLDPRSETQARAAVQAAESAVKLVKAEIERATADLDYATTEHARARKLFAKGTITRQEADNAERAYKTTRADLATRQADLQVKTFVLEQAQAQLLSPTDTQSRASDCVCVNVKAPVSGRVLQIPSQSGRVVQVAETLLEIGNPEDLEIVADYLSTDAVQIDSGQSVIIDNWGQDDSLQGVVRHVEPYGFTKVSALGIEEQRVNVIIDLTSPVEDWQKLGHGYQVETQVVLWESEETLSVPLTALFRVGDQWALFVKKDDRAALRHVQLGRRNGLVAQITEGVAAGDEVIVHPSDRVHDGVGIQARR